MQPILLSKICEIIEVENPFTDRLINFITNDISNITDNCIYFTMIVEGRDGYIFDKQKIKDTNSIVITTKQIDNLDCIIVKSTVSAFAKIAEYIRSQYPELRTLTLSGSIGKTTTKEVIYCVLNEHAKSAKNNGSYNNIFEVCRLVTCIDKSYKNLVMELGLRAPDMPFVMPSKILKPDAAIITNIGHSHIENFKDKEEILEHKLSMTKYMKQDGILFLNGDDELLFNSKYNFKTIFFGIYNKECDYLAENIEKTNEYSIFNIVSKDKQTNIKVKFNAPGEHNILNAVGACAIGKYFGANDIEIIRGLEKFRPSGVRNNLVKGNKCSLIYADCHNATPESMISGFKVLKDLNCTGRKIAVLGHMMRLGKRSEELHRKTGKNVLEYNFDIILTFGHDAYYIYDEVIKAGKKALHFYSKLDLILFLRDYVKPDDAVLFKGVSKFHNFQDLYYGFNDENFKIDNPKYEGIFKDDIKCHSDAAAMYFADNNQLFIGKDINKRVKIKDLAILFAIPAILEKSDLNEQVTISSNAASKFVNKTDIRFMADNVFTVEDLVYAALFKSSFEAVYALIEYAFNSYENFESYLNQKFQQLNIKNTKIGILSDKESDKTYTTAFDAYLYTKNALLNEKFANIFSQKEHELHNIKTDKRTLISDNNKLLKHETHVTYLDYYSELAYGIKAENIYSTINHLPKKNIVSCVFNKENPIIGVILDSDDFYYCNNSYIDMKRILNKLHLFKNYS